MKKLLFALPTIALLAVSCNSSSQSTIQTSTAKPIQLISEQTAFGLLQNVYQQWQSKNGKECTYSDDCFSQNFTEDQKNQIALAYGVINATTSNPSIALGLLKGSSVDVPGIGTGYLASKAELNLQDTAWYWEIGSCATNNRVFVDAKTGKAGLLHTYIYCGGTP